jgi:hypothetical protein
MQLLKWLIVIGVLTLGGCQKDNSHTSVLGGWNCQEFTEISATRTYSVMIERNTNMPTSTNEFAIRNFYRLGNGDDNLVYFRQVNDTLLIIPLQTTATGTSINNGTGKIIGQYERIEWEYTVTSAFGQEKCLATYY